MPKTARQIEAQEAYAKYGSQRQAAKAMGVSKTAISELLAKAKKWDDMPEGVQVAVDTARLDLATAHSGWIKTDTHSTYWQAPKVADDPDAFVNALRDGLDGLPKADHVAQPSGPSDLCAVFPVADLHMGLLTDAEEVGEDWDSKKAAQVFADTFGRLVAVTPGAGRAILAQLGDLTHTDDQRNVTPQSKHQLDADTRFFMILRRAVASMKWAIDALREKYPEVIYRGTRGNHDMTVHYAVTMALAEHYRDVPGVKIVESANEFYVHQFGANMVLLHHGDKAKPERLVQFAAAQWPDIWGKTRHRTALSGHVHHDTRKEIGGMTFESVGTIAPRDAYAYSHAYSANRALVSITLHRDEGEVNRARIGV